MAHHALPFLASARTVAAAAALASLVATACSPDVTGGTRDAEDDCVCDCELGCGPEGPERPEEEADAASGTSSGETSAGSGGGEPGPGGGGGEGPGGGGDAGGGGGGDGGSGGAGGGAGVACVAGASRIAVDVDGAGVETCAVDASLGALNHVTAVLADGHTLIVSFTGQSPSADACVGIAMRAPGNTTAENDWQSGDACDLAITGYDDRVVGTFAATLSPVSDPALGARILGGGELDLAR